MKKTALILLSLFVLSNLCGAAFNKKITFPGKTAGNVVFDHGKHLGQKGMTCKVCHPGVFKQKAGASKVTMAAINKGKFCGVCHKASGKAFAVAKNCQKCHIKSEG